MRRRSRTRFAAIERAGSVYVGATLVALVLPVVSFALYLFVVAYFLVPRGADSDVSISARRW